MPARSLTGTSSRKLGRLSPAYRSRQPPRWAALERVLRGGGWTDADGDAMAWLERRTASELASITLSARAELGMSEAAADPGYVLDLPLSSPTEETTS